MQEGQSSQEITQYMVDRYGDFVTYEPPFRPETILLWFGPVLIFSFGVLLIISLRKNQKTTAVDPLSEEELRSEEHTSELQSRPHLVCRLLLEKKKTEHNRSHLRP